MNISSNASIKNSVLKYNWRFNDYYFCEILTHFVEMNLSSTNKKPTNWGSKFGIFRTQTGIYHQMVLIKKGWIYLLDPHIFFWTLLFTISRNMLGESLGALSVKELKNLETRLEKGISRIRSKKVILLYYLFTSSEYLIKYLDLIIYYLKV